jgi:type IV pilus assembly protein PilY1
VLYILNLMDGSVIKKIDTGAAGNTVVAKNGLSTPIAVDIPRDLNSDGVVDDPDRIVDYIYAGDLTGNLWKFDVTNQAASGWGIAGGGTSPLFVVCATAASSCTDADRQPITGKPQAGAATGAGQDSGMMVYVGSGKYFEDGDNSVPANPQVQSFYGLWDKNTGSATNDRVSGRSDLQAQTITAETAKGAFDLRITSANSVNYPTKRGWYLDLVQPPNNTKQAERVVSYPLLRSGRIVFVTLIPSSNPCEYGGTSWLMELDATSGSRLASAQLDIYGASGAPDAAINSQDMVTVSGTAYAPSGKKSTIGIVKSPGVISGGDMEYKYTSGSSGGLEMTRESAGGTGGRQTWVQLR